ncbi:MAG: FtsX-like permease family protein, partial [Planctomycetes bacterium]|nr:FtsX-like permease family protein [Planctomycetota bacterium]
IILADEPTGNLDSRTGQEIMAIFAKLHESGKTVIMVTHDERLARFADRIISLRDGKMVGEEKVESRTRSTFPAPDLKLQEPSAAASPREMSWRDLVRIGLREGLMAHKMRTALTMLGVLFGVSALIAMSSIGEGARREAIEQIRQMGSNNIRVRDLHLTGEELKEARRKLSDGLTLDDASALKQIIPSIQDIASIKELKVAIRLGEKKPKGKVVATAPEYEKVANFHVERGRFITPADMDACARVCVLGKSLKKELFANEEAIGEEIRLGQDRYTVVGVMEGKDIPKGRMKAISTRDLNHDVYIPLTAGLKRVKKDKEDSELDEIALMVTDAEKVRPTAEVIQTVLDRRHHAVADYEMVVPEELLRQSQQTQRIFNIVMGCIAGISLLVGGIGIMNIMLATVTERTKEIGIRRAVGACERDILRQFLVEAVAISIIGGVVGIALGWAIGRVIALYAKWTTVVSPHAITLGFGVSVAVGILFGIYPAWKAARQDPIQALRYE